MQREEFSPEAKARRISQTRKLYAKIQKAGPDADVPMGHVMQLQRHLENAENLSDDDHRRLQDFLNMFDTGTAKLKPTPSRAKEQAALGQMAQKHAEDMTAYLDGLDAFFKRMRKDDSYTPHAAVNHNTIIQLIGQARRGLESRKLSGKHISMAPVFGAGKRYVRHLETRDPEAAEAHRQELQELERKAAELLARFEKLKGGSG